MTEPKGPAHRKPAACTGCALASRGHGFVPPDGPPNAPILIMGEAPGYDEAAMGRPFVGAAGSMLERILRRNHLRREQFRIGNILSCTPPGLMLDKQQYQYAAIDHCRVHREPLLNEGHTVVVAAGMTALRTLLQLEGHERVRVEEFHGTVHRDPEDRFWIVPTFHPSYLQRGAHNLIGTVSFDMQTALEVSQGSWTPEPLDLVIDPPPDWFTAWGEQYLAAALQDPEGVALSCDMETPDKAGGKPENELGPDDLSYDVQRWNFACNTEQGVTVPNDPAFQPMIRRLLEAQGYHYWWNGSGYDWARTAAAQINLIPRWQLDLMLGAHVLQSDVPLGLGFWAPFYSRFGAWKHTSGKDPARYACIDGPQTQRVGYGIIGDLITAGQWRAYQEDCHELYYGVLKPSQDIGILIDSPALDEFHKDLETKQRRLLHEIQGCVPDAVRALTHETKSAPDDGQLHPEARTHTLKGVPKVDAPDPVKQELYALRALRVSREVTRLIQCCTTCGQDDVHKKHRCKIPGTDKPDKAAVPILSIEERLVVRWFWQEPFNPDSPKQMLGYLAHRGHKPGKSKSTHEDSVDRETLIRLSKTTKDPLYKFTLDYRGVKKVDSTYAVPTMRRIAVEVAAGREPRLHPIPTFRPSTGRLSYVSPNITNVVQDKGGKESLAGGFRRVVVAAPGCRLLEVDYSGIEAVETGFYSRDPNYLRVAKLGVHALLASHLLGRPADLRWSDRDLLAYFAELKKAEAKIYDQAKRCVHGTNYGLTPYGMANTFPDLYVDVKAAERVQAIYFEVCPGLPVWHNALRQRAFDYGALGGPGAVVQSVGPECYRRDYAGPSPWAHPFQYRHWFWSVLAYKPISEAQKFRAQKMGKPVALIQDRWFGVHWGEDSKRVIAFYPQSTAAGVLKRSARALFFDPAHPSYIGDAYYGKTPLRAPIHDSLLLEVPHRSWDRVIEAVAREMQRPILQQPLPAAWNMGSHLTVGVEAKAGQNWKDVETILLPNWTEIGDIGETYFGVEEVDEEDAIELGIVA